MPVVVTGASGFLGSAVIRECLKRSIPVLGFSRRPPAAAADGRVRCVVRYEDAPFPADGRLIHLAEDARIDGGDSVAPARDLFEILAARARRIVYASSAAVYGDSCATPWVENDQPQGVGLYVARKRAVETAALARGSAILRLANIYGPNPPESSILNDILRQLPAVGPVVLRNLEPVRDFLHIDDAARALIHFALSDDTGVYNAGTGRGVSIGALADMVLAAAGQAGRPVSASQADGPPSHLLLDVGKALTAGWRAELPVEDGIRRVFSKATP